MNNSNHLDHVMKNVPRANNIFLVTPHFDLWPALTVDFHFKPYKCWISSHTALSFHQYRR